MRRPRHSAVDAPKRARPRRRETPRRGPFSDAMGLVLPPVSSKSSVPWELVSPLRDDRSELDDDGDVDGQETQDDRDVGGRDEEDHASYQGTHASSL